MAEKILEIQGLKVSFCRDKTWHEVIHGIDLTVNRGEIVGLVGESGSGKSVSSLAVMGLLPEKSSKITSGKILFYEKGASSPTDIASISDKEHRKMCGKRIAMIFQEPMTSLNPVKRCGAQVEEMIAMHEKGISKKELKARVLNLFEEVLLPEPQRIYSSYPHQLSGGQKQRVLISMAIACNPDLLIADEPTTALDVTVQKTILELLKQILQKHNIGILFITHDLGVIKQIANRVVVIYRGNIVEQGLTNDVFYNPQAPYTKGLIASKPKENIREKRLLTIKDFLSNDKPQVHIITKEEREKRFSSLYSSVPILSVKNMNITYAVKKNFWGKTIQETRAVNNVSFDLYQGETLGLVGESGCGKTTLSRAVLELIAHNSGTVTFNGTELSNLKEREMRLLRKRLQIIFQDPYSSLNPRITVGNAIMEVMRQHSIYSSDTERKSHIMELLVKVGLDEVHFSRYPHEFSGGQRQRIGIARALATKPEVVICDESVSALDVSVQAQVLNLINDLKDEYGFSCIFISHDLSVVKYMSDRIIVMQKGSIVEQGEADGIYFHPKESYTKRLIDSICK
jgi:ATPase components of various ABC-type transport systems, contain duplicated ATPase